MQNKIPNWVNQTAEILQVVNQAAREEIVKSLKGNSESITHVGKTKINRIR